MFFKKWSDIEHVYTPQRSEHIVRTCFMCSFMCTFISVYLSHVKYTPTHTHLCTYTSLHDFLQDGWYVHIYISYCREIQYSTYVVVYTSTPFLVCKNIVGIGSQARTPVAQSDCSKLAKLPLFSLNFRGEGDLCWENFEWQSCSFWSPLSSDTLVCICQ